MHLIQYLRDHILLLLSWFNKLTTPRVDTVPSIDALYREDDPDCKCDYANKYTCRNCRSEEEKDPSIRQFIEGKFLDFGNGCYSFTIPISLCSHCDTEYTRWNEDFEFKEDLCWCCNLCAKCVITEHHERSHQQRAELCRYR